jgi:hypothetical protein
MLKSFIATPLASIIIICQLAEPVQFTCTVTEDERATAYAITATALEGLYPCWNPHVAVVPDVVEIEKLPAVTDPPTTTISVSPTVTPVILRLSGAVPIAGVATWTMLMDI